MSVHAVKSALLSLTLFLRFIVSSGQVAPQTDWAALINDPELKSRGVEDDEWADYLRSIEPGYDEARGFPEVTTSNPEENFFVQNLNFSLTGKGEVPFMAVLYQLLEDETPKDGGALDGVHYGRACGGVLVALDRLITPCGCVISYFGSYYANIQTEEYTRPPFPFDLGWKTSGRYLFGLINRIYVQYGLTRFHTGIDMPGLNNPVSDMHLVEKGETKGAKLTIDQECYEVAKRVWLQDGRFISASKSNIEAANHALALVPYGPQLEFTVPGAVIPWPPFVFNDDVTQNRLATAPDSEEKVIVSGMGFRKAIFGRDCPTPWKIKDDDGRNIRLSRTSINIPMVHCVIRPSDDETCPRTFNIQDQWFRLSCFCDLYDRTTIPANVGCKVIYNGTIGWPILYNGNVVALTVSARNPRTPGNRLLGSSLAFQSFRDHVVKTLTQEGIDAQRTNRPPRFREDIEHWSVVYYDYPARPEWFVHMGTTPRLIPFAIASHLGPHLAVSTLVPLLSLIAHFTNSYQE